MMWERRRPEPHPSRPRPTRTFAGGERIMQIVLLLVALTGRGLAADAADSGSERQWPQWRGPLADGTSPHANPPIHWSNTKNIRWKQEIPGEGGATPIVWRDQVFIVAAVKTDRLAENPPKADARAKTNPPAKNYQFVVLSLDRKTGEEQWRRVACEEAPHEGRHSTNSFASASPTTDGKRLYVSFGSRGIYCFDLDGRPLWSRDLGDMRTRYGWGEATSPVVHGDSLIINWDHEDQSFIAVLNTRTGETRWKADRDEPTSWATPLVVEHKGRTQIIVNGTNRVRSYDLATGRVIWQCGGQTVNAIPSPIAADGVVYCMSGYLGSFAVAVSLDAQGDLGENADGGDKSSILWRHGRGTPYVPSPVLVENQLYFTRRNSAVLSSLNIATGKPVFAERRLPGLSSIYASPVSAQGRIYIVGRDGTTLVIEHGPQLKVLATNQLDEPIDASPALAGKQLFLRGARHVYCIEEDREKPEESDSTSKAVRRALSFLAAETPRWRKKNKCYSCHNNGDAARALYMAVRLGYRVDADALADTTIWLSHPEQWKHNGGDGEFNEKDLATLQFSAALAEAVRAGRIKDRKALGRAARMAADLQQADGSWRVNAMGTIGAPVNFGDALATAEALRVLRQVNARNLQSKIENGERWLRAKTPKNVLDAAGLLIGLRGAQDQAATRRRKTCLTLIAAGRNKSGGWGPFVTSAAEPYDTALVLLALAGLNGDAEQTRMIEQGRRYLTESQLDDGSWTETTRPAGALSYAQRLSTAGWAARALLATMRKRSARDSLPPATRSPD